MPRVTELARARARTLTHNAKVTQSFPDPCSSAGDFRGPQQGVSLLRPPTPATQVTGSVTATGSETTGGPQLQPQPWIPPKITKEVFGFCLFLVFNPRAQGLDSVGLDGTQAWVVLEHPLADSNAWPEPLTFSRRERWAPPIICTLDPGHVLAILTPAVQNQLVWGTAWAGGVLKTPWGILTCR